LNGGRSRGERFLRVGYSGSGIVIDFDEVDRVGGDVAIRGDDNGHRMSDIVDAIAGQDRMRRHAQAGQ
jgi:hypothetical protein